MTDKHGSRGIDVRQGLFEAVLIFVGVAVALAGQSWWDYRQDRILEREYVAGLVNELEDTRGGLVDVQARRQAFQIRATRLLEVMGDATVPAREDSIVRGVTDLGWVPGYRPPRATLDALVASGDLDVIRDPTLRLQIARYAEELNEYEATAAFVSRHYERVIEAFFLSEAWSFLDGGPRGREPDGLATSRWEVDVEGLLGSRDLENRIASYLWTQRDVLRAGSLLLEHVDDLRGCLGGAPESCTSADP